jgi:hypothetical protein
MSNMPANVRISAQFPFPASVSGTTPIAITKANGIWSVALPIGALATQLPSGGSLTTDYVLVWDSLTNTYFKMPISNIPTGPPGPAGPAGPVGPTGPAGGIRVQRLVTASPIVVGGGDQIFNCNIGVAAACALPASATRTGNPLTFKDVGGQFGAHNLTITPNGVETIDGAATFVATANRQSITLNPFNDGTNSGWFIT